MSKTASFTAVILIGLSQFVQSQVGPIGGDGHGSVKSVSYDNDHSFQIQGTVSDATDNPLIQLAIRANTIVPNMLTLSATHRLLGRDVSSTLGNAQEISITQALDWIDSTAGAILFRGSTNWSSLGAPLVASVLTYGAAPQWEALSDFQLSAAKDQVNGYAGLNGSGKINNTELSGVELSANKGAVSGYAPLDASQHVPNTNLGSGAAGAGAKALFDDHTFKSVAGGGSIVDVAVATAAGVSGSSNHDPTTPTLTISLGAITPTSVAASGTVGGSNLSGSNTGDQTITLTGDVAGTGTGSFAATIGSNKVTYAKFQQAANAYRLLGNPTNAAGNFAEVPVEASQFSSGTLKTFAPASDLSGTTTPHADASVTKSFFIVLSGNTTFTFDNFTDGDSIVIRTKQAAAGGPYTVTYPTTTWQGGSQPVQTTTANKSDFAEFHKQGSTIYASIQANF